MSANNNTGDNSGPTNDINNENAVITVNRDNDHISSRNSSTNKSQIPDKIIDLNIKSVDNQNDSPENKSSNRNTINFMGKVDNLCLGWLI